ncbi:response regulator [Paenibacillus hexagrammi]|uniref:response regulator n=1 Tax=Paenibacillus hexagrammi TaxID=2908839 RepID=UPI002883020E|nr:response regulator [Paenibacillus sp. YPD9-1]
MYKVMLVDDDYPVIELLSEAIPWEELGLRLIGTHDNGLDAWEQARMDLPDIVITDIGMPKMNGLEFIGLLKKEKPNVRVAILSCHSEFQFAQQAMRMNVQEYLLKDTLNPVDLERLLGQFKESLDTEQQVSGQQSRLLHMVDETREVRKEQWIRNFLHQPVLSPQEWRKEAASYGLLEEGSSCIAAVGRVESFRQAKLRFLSVQTLRFAINNVLEEVMQSLHIQGLHIGYGSKESILLFSYRPDLKTNVYDQIAIALKTIQEALLKTLKLQMSFVIGDSADSPEELKAKLLPLLENDAQRFYQIPGSMIRKKASKPAETGSGSVYFL